MPSKRKTPSTRITFGKPNKKTTKGLCCQLSIHGTPISFLDLPLEIRDIVYRKATLPRYLSGYVRSITVPNSDLGGGHLWQPALAMTCRQVREEALPIYYSINHFHIGLLNLHFCPLRTWLESMHPAHAKAITVLAIYLEGPEATWSDVRPWLEIEEKYLSAEIKVHYFSESNLAYAWETACDTVTTLKTAGVKEDVIDTIMAKTSDIVGAALNFGNLQWPNQKEDEDFAEMDFPDGIDDEEEQRDSDESDDIPRLI